MTERNELTTTSTSTAKQPPVLPAVDIFEDVGGITVLADMPGVSKDRLDVRLDGDSLVIEGDVQFDAPAEMRPLWAEVSVPKFRRSFTLSRELDAGRIEANLKDGVLTLRLPKHANAQPRRVEVTTG